MPQYRLYHLDRAGQVRTAEWLDAGDDNAAIAAAGVDNASVQCELWQGRRLVTRLADGIAISPGSSPTGHAAPIPPQPGAGRSGAHRT